MILDPGFGNHIDDSIIPAANKRARANKYTNSSQSTEVQSNQRYFLEVGVQQVLDGKDEQFAHTLAEKEQTWNERFARSDNLIAFLYAKLGMPLTHNMVPSMMMPRVTSLQTGLPVSIETGQHSLLMPGVTTGQSEGMSTDEIVSQPLVPLVAMPSVNGFT